ncbi:MAG: hypothetical protein EOO87_09090 [Pedobacter sp.]|nr:MAG: hypothetical protein EOO87_09090 [Pedobacter sp.]
MEVMIGFVAELIKISILSCIYAFVAMLIFKIIGSYKHGSWFDRVSRKKLKLWLLSGFFISLGLFIFMFTHYGDHGLGDSARVPIGHWREIQQTNGTLTYIQEDGKVSVLAIDKFVIADDYLYGFISDMNENYNAKYFIYDLVNNNIKTYEEINGYLNFLTTKNLHERTEYKDFNYYYRQYWTGWRFWILP